MVTKYDATLAFDSTTVYEGAATGGDGVEYDTGVTYDSAIPYDGVSVPVHAVSVSNVFAYISSVQGVN
jgi:hypothetical protein